MTSSPIHRKTLLAQKRVKISCIVPVYNEATGISHFLLALVRHMQTLGNPFEIIVIDDGSEDNTAALVEALCNETENHIKLITFSRNFGKEIALTAGLEHCSGDAAILIDADFQHPLELITLFIEKWSEGYDMVYGVQSNRQNETVSKRLFARLFYWLLGLSTKVTIPAHAGDFRILDRTVIDALIACKERKRFMKGLYAWVGFNSIAIPFAANERFAGKSSWGFLKLLRFGITGLISFSDLPLQVWGLIGLIISAISFTYALCIVLSTLISGVDVPGYATLVVAVMFFGGIQLLSIGILGEYIARIFNEVKNRPIYIIAKKTGFN